MEASAGGASARGIAQAAGGSAGQTHFCPARAMLAICRHFATASDCLLIYYHTMRVLSSKKQTKFKKIWPGRVPWRPSFAAMLDTPSIRRRSHRLGVSSGGRVWRSMPGAMAAVVCRHAQRGVVV